MLRDTSFADLTGRLSRLGYAHLLLAASIVYAAVMLLTFPPWTVDDASITFRYAYNLAHHGELNWNVGLDPVEGYTGVLLPVMLAGAIKLGIAPAIASQAIGIAAFIACAVLIWRCLDMLAVRPMLVALALTLYLSSPFFYTHVFAGLETMLFGALLVAAFYALLRRADVALLLLLLLTSLTRPEGVLFAAVLLVIRLLELWQQGQRRALLVFLGLAAALYVLPGAAYFAWRWSYYGHLLPNTFYVKAGGNAGIRDVADWLLSVVIIPLAAVLLLRPNWQQIQQHRLALRGLVVFIVLLCSFYALSTLIMNYSHRFFMPLYPLVLILLAVAAHVVQRPGKVGPAVLLLAAQLVLNLSYFTYREIDNARFYALHQSNEHLPVARYINQHIPADEWVILSDAGVIPFQTMHNTIDAGGLNDEFFAHEPDTAARTRYLETFDAAAIVVGYWGRPDDETQVGYEQMEMDNYRLVKGYLDPAWEQRRQESGMFRLYLFVREDLLEQPDE